MMVHTKATVNILTTTATFSTGGFPDYIRVISNPYGRKLTEQEITELIVEYQPEGIIAGVEPFTRRVFDKAKKLKVISRCGIGVDSIDLKAAEEHNIKVFITPDAPTASVAEFTIALILALMRRIIDLDRNVREKIFKGDRGILLSGKTVGIIGCGRIGSYVAKLLHTFGCNLIGNDLYVREHEFCKMASKEDLLRSSEIVTLHIPFSKENKHIISKNEFQIMKDSSIIINTARGGLIDESYLVEAIHSGKIAGAAIDCFQEEPYFGELICMSNVILTPHMGSSTLEGIKYMETEALKNLFEGLKM